MNKTNKGQLNLKNKLIAATAMLLVASIMMVSTTYAWFTLSTAPEIQGITTTIGSNGNLEIALAYPTGDNSLITSGTNASGLDWTVKNLTWGNLLNLEDSSYGLSSITLLPSQLNINNGGGTTANTISGSPLAIPVYGADGRISGLDAEKMNYGYKNPDGVGFIASDGHYGVRALGTSSTQSETELNFRVALNTVNTNRGKANTIVTSALHTYGSALADVAIMHKNEQDSGTAANYAPLVPNMLAMVNELSAADELIEEALINAMIAISNANITYGTEGGTLGDAEITDGVTMRDYMKTANSMTAIWSNVTTAGLEDGLEAAFPELVSAYNTWNSTKTQVADTKSQLEALDENNVVWADLSPAMRGLMNTTGVTINGKGMDELDEAFLLQNAQNLTLELGAGSGVIANYSKLTGTISTTVKLSDNAVYQGRNLAGFDINLVSEAPAAGALLSQVRATINGLGAATTGESTSSLDVLYGYVLDFVFRTNAANSNLLLQTEGEQRIYSDGTNEATMGKGSTLTYSAKLSDLESLISMMSGIRVVFTNTTGESTEVYGIAKALFEDLELPISLNTATRGSQQIDGEQTYEAVYTEGAAASNVKVTLTTVEEGTNVKLVLKTGAHQYIVISEYEDDETEGKDYLWTAKTAMWYEKTENGVTEEVELTDADGNLLFYPAKALNTADGTFTDTDINDYLATVTDDMADDFSWLANVNAADTSSATIQEAVTANWTEPVYYAAHDADNANVKVEAPLYLHNYTISDAGVLSFGGTLSGQTLTSLDQNVITGVSALVYLDGNYVENSDVVNSETGIATSGMMNLQFASSANLIPMENTALKTGEQVNVTWDKPGDVSPVAQNLEKATKGQDYTFAMTSNAYTVTYKVGEAGTVKTLTGTQAEQGGVQGYVYTIPGAEITDAITITIAAATP